MCVDMCNNNSRMMIDDSDGILNLVICLQILLNLDLKWANRIPALRISLESRIEYTEKFPMDWKLASLSAVTSTELCSVPPLLLPSLVAPSVVVTPLLAMHLGRWWKSIGNYRWEVIVFLGEISEISKRPCSYYMTNEYCFSSPHSNVGSSIEPGLGQLWYWFPFVISDSLLK